jgi:hypothetical protein
MFGTVFAVLEDVANRNIQVIGGAVNANDMHVGSADSGHLQLLGARRAAARVQHHNVHLQATERWTRRHEGGEERVVENKREKEMREGESERGRL